MLEVYEMKKILVGLVSFVLIVIILYFGYSTIRTLSGNPIAMSKAEKLALEFIKHTYPNDDFVIGEGAYMKSYGNYNFEVLGTSGAKVNELVIQEGLKTIEDTSLTRELNAKVEQFIANSSLPIEQLEVNGTVYFISKNFNKKDDVWITFSGTDLTNEKVAKFGKNITIWGKENGFSLNELIVDFTNLTTNESYRLTVTDKEFDKQNFESLIVKRD
jgi:hypothetical protein